MTRRPAYTPEIQKLHDAVLSPEEARERLAAAMLELDQGDELENLTALISWFRRRYPTALERLRYLRKKTLEAQAHAGRLRE